MEEQIQKLTEEINKLLQEKRNYERNKREERFIEDVDKNEDELINDIDNILDRNLQEKERIENIVNKKQQIELTIDQLRSEVLNLMDWVKDEDKRICTENNELIEKRLFPD